MVRMHCLVLYAVDVDRLRDVSGAITFVKCLGNIFGTGYQWLAMALMVGAQRVLVDLEAVLPLHLYGVILS